MKKRKKLAMIMIMAILTLPEIASATEYLICDEKRIPAVVPQMTSTFMTIIKIAVPILLVISGMISFLKVTYASNVEDQMKKAKSKLINNIIAAGIIFFVFSIANFGVSMVAGPNNKFTNCAKCFIEYDKCNVVELTDEELEPGFIDPEKNEQTESDQIDNEPEIPEDAKFDQNKTLLEATADYSLNINGISDIKTYGEDIINFEFGELAKDVVTAPVRKFKSGTGIIKSIFK